MIRLTTEASRERERERERRWLRHSFNDIISFENLLVSWQEFLCGKRKRKDVAEFSLHLTDNILNLHHDLVGKTYRHGRYQPFRISDPKPREIHKATVRDRLVHHAIHRVLYPFFDRHFIFDSYSCRDNKGTHRAMNRFRAFGYKVSRNQTQTAWVLKCDIHKFFANIEHLTLKNILTKNIGDNDTLWLLDEVINSFSSNVGPGIGLPLGNLTSQLLVNIYMNEFDQFVKRQLKINHYIRYADDFVILSSNQSELETLRLEIETFLAQKLKLALHPDKVYIKTLASGVDFLGWVHFSDHRVLRCATKRRVIHKMASLQSNETYQSYRGILQHGNGHQIQARIDKIFNAGRT